jgi:hypothetical protein
MWRFGFEVLPAYLLVVGLLTFFVAVILWQRQRTGKTVAVWLSAGILGILLGSVGSYALVRWAGYHVVPVPIRLAAGEADFSASDEEEAAATEEGGEQGGSGEREGRGSGGGGGMRGGMGGEMFGTPRPKRDLTTLVRKIELLTGDVALTLTPDQATALIESLGDIEKAEAILDEEAQAKHDEILALLDDGQKLHLEAISLPRAARGGPGGGGPGGGGPPAEPDNPFQDEATSQALASLRQRFQAAP